MLKANVEPIVQFHNFHLRLFVIFDFADESGAALELSVSQ